MTSGGHSPIRDERQTTNNPRAFVTTTGFVFQIVGGVLALGGCCLWSASGWFQDPLEHPLQSLSDYFDSPPQALALVALVATFVGGFGLLATGLGLQGEHPRSGAAALAVSATLAVTCWGCLIGFLLTGGSVVQGVVAAVLAAGSTLLFMLAGSSARILRLHPPPADRSVVTEEFLESQRRARRD